MDRLRRYILMAAAAWAVILMPGQAMAHEMLRCTDPDNPTTIPGTPVEGTSLFNTDSDNSDGDFSGSACRYTNTGLQNIFGQITCNFAKILNDILGKTYCALQYTLFDTVKILMVLYVVVFGVQILMGTAQLNAREILTRLLKIGAVAMFISQSVWGIEIAFTFFMDIAAQGIRWALRAMSSVSGASDFCADMTGNMPVYACIDTMIFNVVTGPFTQANSKLIGFFAVMAYVIPPIFGLAVYWLWITFAILARALISFLLCVAALGFLLSLSPIFLSFMLFQATRQFFENWLKFMISFSLQVAIVFACIAAWAIVSTNFIHFFDELGKTIFQYQKVWTTSAATVDPVDSWGICPYVIEPHPVTGSPSIRCTRADFDPVGSVPDCYDPALYPPPMIPGPLGTFEWCSTQVLADRKDLIPLSDIAQKKCEAVFGPPAPGCTTSSLTQTGLNQLIYYVLYHLITLIIVFYAFDALLKQVPTIAKELAGPTYIPMLGQGFGATGFGRARGEKGAMAPRSSPFTPGQAGEAGGGGVGSIVSQYGKSVGTR